MLFSNISSALNCMKNFNVLFCLQFTYAKLQCIDRLKSSELSRTVHILTNIFLIINILQLCVPICTVDDRHAKFWFCCYSFGLPTEILSAAKAFGPILIILFQCDWNHNKFCTCLLNSVSLRFVKFCLIAIYWWYG